MRINGASCFADGPCSQATVWSREGGLGAHRPLFPQRPFTTASGACGRGGLFGSHLHRMPVHANAAQRHAPPPPTPGGPRLCLDPFVSCSWPAANGCVEGTQSSAASGERRSQEGRGYGHGRPQVCAVGQGPSAVQAAAGRRRVTPVVRRDKCLEQAIAQPPGGWVGRRPKASLCT